MSTVSSLSLIGKTVILKNGKTDEVIKTLNTFQNGTLEVVGLTLKTLGDVEITDVKEIIKENKV